MKNSLALSVFFSFVALSLFSFSFNAPGAAGQEGPDVLLTWSAENFAPPPYQGASLPSSGTPVEFAVEVVENGKLVDLSKQEIRWFINDDLKRSGLGLQNFSFIAGTNAASAARVGVSIIGYRGADLEKTVALPLGRPEIVIDAPFPDRRIPSLAAFRALPYFFNIRSFAELTLTWLANGEQTAGGEELKELKLDVKDRTPGTTVTLNLRGVNRANELEFAEHTLFLTTQ